MQSAELRKISASGNRNWDFNGEDATSSDAYGATFPSRGRLIWNTVSSIEVKFTVFFCETNILRSKHFN